MSPPIIRIILYVKNIPKVAAFYGKHFGFTPLPGATTGWVELAGPNGGCTIALHQAAKAQKSGAAMKIVFAVLDVSAFRTAQMRAGLKFGPIHQADSFAYANAKDPAGNSISISSRGL
jgi:predicted enzyme related to lactoylglutathione lyase